MNHKHNKELENTLALMANRKYCLLLSRGATALYVSYCTLKKQQPQKNKIVLPATMCHSPANVALYANLEIIFCDVSQQDYTLDAECLKSILETTEGILAVVSVSIFGHAPDMKGISEACKKHNVYLIDDAAQSIGGSSFGIPSGGWGDIGIFSFGHTKIIDAGWGGAILTDNESIYNECKNAYEVLQPPAKNINELRAIYSKTYYTVEKLTYASPLLNPLFWSFPDIFKNLYLYKQEGSENKIIEISEKLKTLPEIIELRKNNRNAYKDNLEPNENILFPVLREGTIPWRFTFRIKTEKRDFIINELRNRNIDASTWYPSLKNRFKHVKDQKNNECKIAELISNELVNLWVDPEKINTDQIKKNCILINELINR